MRVLVTREPRLVFCVMSMSCKPLQWVPDLVPFPTQNFPPQPLTFSHVPSTQKIRHNTLLWLIFNPVVICFCILIIIHLIQSPIIQQMINLDSIRIGGLVELLIVSNL